MPTISSRWYAELNDFLPYRVRQRAIEPAVEALYSAEDP
jgi:hypothetical protein